MTKRFSAVLLAAVTTAAGLGLALSTPAAAADRDGSCNTGELCYYFNTGYAGSRSDFFYNDANLADNTYLSTGNGKGQVVKNNAAGGFNFETYLHVSIWYNSNFNNGTYTGRSDTLPAGTGDGQFDNVYNENASHSFW
ncbi:peptidase inhibitor family I36 protein [Streptomyces sp. NPDC056600]|uniref:peptidase inhibitor family I36 protein n=1 Tax=Streptomyces sp. NPDC056600 TaxID=3345874 RepID=UPI003675609A